MKKLYTIGMGLSLAILASNAFGQVGQVNKLEPVERPTAEITTPTTTNKVKSDLQKDFPTAVLWNEDFSNGLDGSDNGAWTTSLAQGNLWFHTFPVGAPNGYDPDSPIADEPGYNGNLPQYFGARDVVSSPTRDNGVMFLDVDRFNGGDGEEFPVLSALVSPSIDMSGWGTTNLQLIFYQYLRQCCSGYAATAELSVDGGTTWIPYDVFSPYGGGNSDIDIMVAIDISSALENAADLTNVKVRFVWAGAATAYFWSIDDVAFQTIPDNDLELGATFYNDYLQIDMVAATTQADVAEYFSEFEYNRQPEYYARPFTFGGVITNAGLLAQTGVTLHVDATLPDGTVVTDFATSTPMEMAPGAVDTIFTADVMPDPLQTGEYTFEYRVTQNEEEQVPATNIGDSRTARINSEAANGGMAILGNDAGLTGGSGYPTLGEDKIWGTQYIFPESTSANPKAITHLEVVIVNIGDFTPSQPNNVFYYNVRIGSPLVSDPAIPESLTHVFFDTEDTVDYDDQSIRHLLLEDEIWYSDETNDVTRLMLELPAPILIDPNQTYQGEIRVPNNGGIGMIWPAICTGEEEFASMLYDFADGTWSYLGSNSISIRLRTQDFTDGVPQITSENGLVLVQNYPNPFTDQTKIQYRIEESSQVSLEVHDITGKLVFSKDMGMASAGIPVTYTLQRGDLAPGVYTYSLVTADNIVTRKLTVQ